MARNGVANKSITNEMLAGSQGKQDSERRVFRRTRKEEEKKEIFSAKQNAPDSI
jgi:hypothetical protein